MRDRSQRRRWGRKTSALAPAVAVSPFDENPDLYPLSAQGHCCYTQQSLGRQRTHVPCAEGDPQLMRNGRAVNYKLHRYGLKAIKPAGTP